MMLRRIFFVLPIMLFLIVSPVTAQSDALDTINTLLDQAQTALDNDDLPTAQALMMGANALISADLIAECPALQAAGTLLEQAISGETVAAAQALLAGARALIDGCEGTSTNAPSISEMTSAPPVDIAPTTGNIDWTISPPGSPPPIAMLENFAAITRENANQLTLLGQMGRGSIEAVTWSPHDELLAVAGSLGVWLYEVNNIGAPPRLLEASSAIGSLAFSSDGAILAAGNMLRTAQAAVDLWDVGSGQRLGTLEVGQTVSHLAFYPGGSMLAVGTTGREVQLWNVAAQDSSQIDTLRGLAGITSLTFHQQNGTVYLAAGNENGGVQMWEVDADGGANEIASNSEYTEEIMALAFAGPNLVIAAESGAVRTWGFLTVEPMQSLQEGVEDADIASMAFNAQGVLAVGEEQGGIRLLSPGDYAEQEVLEGHTKMVRSMAFSSDGRILASAGDDSTLRLWDVGTGEELLSLDDHVRSMRDIALSRSNDIVTSVGIDGKVRLWWLTSGLYGDFYTGIQSYVIVGDVGTPWGGSAWSALYSPDGSTLAYGDNYFVRLWNTVTGEAGRAFLFGPIVHSISFSPDGTLVAGGGGLREGIARVWNIESGTEVLNLEGRVGSLATVLFGLPNNYLITGGTGDIQYIQIWDITTGNELTQLRGHDGGIFALALSPDRTLLASGSSDQTVRLWSIATRQELAVLQGHTGEVDALAFSPDGLLLASGSHDQSIRIWDVETGEMLAAFENLPGGVTGLAFTSGGQLLISGGSVGVVRIWGVQTASSD